ncbi:MAG: alpha/beta hydrolase [Clostridia bacterium]|nr:alpha/beta hydrolase [Clostridia bacterium]
MLRILKFVFKAVSLILLILLAVFIFSYFTGYKVYRNVSYGDGEQNVMDVYLPNEANLRDNNGCVLFIHGGSWSGGDKWEEEARCRLLASRGYMAVSMNYTLISDENADVYTVFAVLDEIDAALSTAVSFAAERGIAIDQAATSGYSAGAHLAMLYAYSRADSAPVEIKFTSSMAGPADISPAVWGNDLAARIGTILSGEEITVEMLGDDAVKELLVSISPVSYITCDSVPTAIIQGGNDTTVSPANADSLIKHLSENSVAYDYVHLKDSDHSLLQNPILHLSYYNLLLDYCDAYFD